MSSSSCERSDDEDQVENRTYYVISDYTAIEDSQVLVDRTRIL